VNRSWLFVALLVACKSEPNRAPEEPTPGSASAPAPTPPPPIDKAALLAGKLPSADTDPTTEIVYAQCQICHSIDYLTQQRLGEAGWKKTIEKMRKFGANITDEQVTALVSYATRYWNTELPPRAWTTRVAPPAAAMPIAVPAPKAP